MPIAKTFDTEIARLAEKYGQDESLARGIIKCESQQYNDMNNKNYLKGVLWSTDWGYWQINDYYHEETAMKLGFDIQNEWDNLEFGFILLSEQGTRPWKASQACWLSKEG